MAEKKFEELTHLNKGYKLAAKVDEIYEGEETA